MAGTDRELLNEFIAGGGDLASSGQPCRPDEAAFAELVRRHGGMVMGVCERVARADAEDAFQATFLALARSASRLRRRESLASWLHRVALRVSVDAKRRAARRRRHERRVAEVSESKPESVWRELGEVLDEELDRMPERLRAPVVLCCIEGKTTEEAARELGWSHGALRARLAKAKELLRGRLRRRGIVVGAAVLAAAISDNALAAIPGEGCAASTVGAAHAFASAGTLPSGVVSPEVASLALRATKVAARAKVQTIAAAAAVAAGILIAAVLALKGPSRPAGPAAHAEPERVTAPARAHVDRPGLVEIADAEAVGFYLPEAVRRALLRPEERPEEARYPGAAVESAEKVTVKGVRPAVVTVRPGLVPLAGKWRARQTKKHPSPGTEITALAGELVAPDVDDSAWPEHLVPGPWEGYGGEWADMDGEAVFRKTVSVPEGWSGNDLLLSLGAIDDFDDTFFNGQKIGRTDRRTPNFWEAPRRYRVPARLVRPGRNVIAVRVFDQVADGGFRGRAEEMFLRRLAAAERGGGRPRFLERLEALFKKKKDARRKAEGALPPAQEGVSLAGKWRARQTKKLQPAPGTGMTALAGELVAPEVDDSAWSEHEVPGDWEAYGGEWADMDGEAVFRRTVIVPEQWSGEDLLLSLGAIDDFDDTFFNGGKIGWTDGGTPGFWWVQRRYRVPAGLVRPGRNVIAVRVFDRGAGGGFGGRAGEMFLKPAAAGRAGAKTWPISILFTETGEELSAYRVRLEVNGKACEVEITPAGELLRATEEIAAGDLPEAVAWAIGEIRPAAVVKDARRKTEGAFVFYEVGVIMHGREQKAVLPEDPGTLAGLMRMTEPGGEGRREAFEFREVESGRPGDEAHPEEF